MISNGPLSAFIGTVEKAPKVQVFDVAMRLKLISDMFGRATPMESSADDVSKI